MPVRRQYQNKWREGVIFFSVQILQKKSNSHPSRKIRAYSYYRIKSVIRLFRLRIAVNSNIFQIWPVQALYEELNGGLTVSQKRIF